ncbi:MAG: Fatty acid desaturase, type 2 [Phycisphaerales bacterium]|nr:Fatty acid desaturase, type 2 [Phycisphaerales bacterium]
MSEAQPLPSDKAFVGPARGLVADLFRPRPGVYWADLLASVAVAYVGFALVHAAALPWPARVAAFVLSGLAFYRVAMFTHELVHLNHREMIGFRIAWNVLVGLPLLVPTFLYYTHLDHHRPKHYATRDDGEYLPLGRGPAWMIAGFLISGLWVPALVVLRFAVLTPASWVSAWARSLIHRYASALVIDPMYARPAPNDRERRVWRMQEVICLVYLWSVAALVATGRLSWTWVAQAYGLAVFVLTINAVRTLAAHRYRHLPDETSGTLVEQLVDSINHPGRPLLTEVWAPVGLRFHALHHLFPGLPYHALPEAHRRLTEGLPPDSPYHSTNSPSLGASLRQLWRNAAAAARERAGATRAGNANCKTFVAN